MSRLGLVLVVAIAGFVLFDVNKHGSLKSSKTGVFLRNCGVLQYTELALNRFRQYSQQAYWWYQKNGPIYREKALDHAIHFLLSVKDVITTLFLSLWTNATLIWQYFLDKKPFIQQWVNHNLPGLQDNVTLWLSQFRDFAVLLSTLLIKYCALMFQWLRENILIGKLSPENLQRFTMEAINTTQSLAVQTLSWLNNKVVTMVSSV